MRVLQINCVYKFGSTGKIVYDLHSAYIEQGIESYVCYGRGAKTDDNNVYKTASEVVAKGYNFLSRFTGIQYGGAYRATNKLIYKIKEIQPDIVHLHCINGFFVNIYRLLEYLKCNEIKTVLTLHAEFMYTGSCGYALECEQWRKSTGCRKCPQLREATGSYVLDRTALAWKKMKASLDDFDNLVVVSVSPWLEQRAIESTIMKDKKHQCVLNGIDTNIFRYVGNEEFKSKIGLAGKKIAIYVTASFSSFKGGTYIIELAKMMPEIIFLIVGNQGNIGSHPDNIIPMGRVENQIELAKYYSMADVTVLTSKQETFSMVCAESLACGTPVVGFKAGAPEVICLSEYSMFCEYGDVEGMKEAIFDVINGAKYRKKETIARLAQEKYSKDRMCSEYLEIYERLYYGI